MWTDLLGTVHLWSDKPKCYCQVWKVLAGEQRTSYSCLSLLRTYIWTYSWHFGYIREILGLFAFAFSSKKRLHDCYWFLTLWDTINIVVNIHILLLVFRIIFVLWKCQNWFWVFPKKKTLINTVSTWISVLGLKVPVWKIWKWCELSASLPLTYQWQWQNKI